LQNFLEHKSHGLLKTKLWTNFEIYFGYEL